MSRWDKFDLIVTLIWAALFAYVIFATYWVIQLGGVE